eukprot:9308761-Karenia_brevis.AAC.1
MYWWLSQRRKGKAQQIVSMTPESNGWEALRLIRVEFRPRACQEDRDFATKVVAAPISQSEGIHR